MHRLLPRWPRLYRHPADIFQHNTTLSIYIPPPSIICLRATQQPCVILHVLNSDTGTTINFTLIMSQKVPKHSIITMLHIFCLFFKIHLTLIILQITWFAHSRFWPWRGCYHRLWQHCSLWRWEARHRRSHFDWFRLLNLFSIFLRSSAVSLQSGSLQCSCYCCGCNRSRKWFCDLCFDTVASLQSGQLLNDVFTQCCHLRRWPSKRQALWSLLGYS